MHTTKARNFALSLIMGASLATAACGADAEPTDSAEVTVAPGDFTKGIDGKGDASAVAVFVDFEFEGELLTDRTWNPNKQVEEQMLYTIGHLNEDNSVGRLDKLELTNVNVEDAEGGLNRITYSAKLLVAWGKKNDVPQRYTLKLPKNVSFAGLEDFADKYARDCVDFGAHDVTSGSMWYYYRPESYRCDIDESDIVTLDASVTVSDINTTGKYPEYHKIWEDDVLKVVAVFGKYEDGATSDYDAGISAYNRFSQTMKDELGMLENFETTPADIPSKPGVDLPDITFVGEMADGQRVEVVALLVDNVRTAGADFTRRYEELSGPADLIVYNGHAGLGANIRALAQKGRWIPGQYSIVFMNGCDTYAYVDTALNDARAAINEDDPNGTKYLDIVTNAMPSFFREMSNATNQLIRGLMSIDDPKTFEQMFVHIDESEVVLVSGEQDNEFVPGAGGDSDVVTNWEGMEENGMVNSNDEMRFSTPTLAEGAYRFDLSGTNDADLYVRIGNEPTVEAYDCRPFKWGSEESCLVEISSPTTIHVMVRGWDDASEFTLVGRQN